jgi:IstB-like ATP binding protein
MLKSLARMQVLILDDWGITPLTAEQRRDLLEIFNDRHGRASGIGHFGSSAPHKLRVNPASITNRGKTVLDQAICRPLTGP